MNDLLLPKRKRRHVLDLQLTAMIDIFSLIVIFLIKGTVFGVSDLPVDRDVKLPKSRSKETLDTAPYAQIVGEKVAFSGAASTDVRQGIPFEELSAGGSGRDHLAAEVKAYLSKIPPESKSSGILLSVIADRDATYGRVFEVVKFFREQGFESLLFVASAEEGK